MQCWHYGKGLIYYRPIFRLTKLASLRQCSYIGKNNKSNIAIRAHLSSLVVEWRDLVEPDHVTTFSISKLSGGRPNFVDGMIAYYLESLHFQKRACVEMY